MIVNIRGRGHLHLGTLGDGLRDVSRQHLSSKAIWLALDKAMVAWLEEVG